jgi:hypothetical protein
MTLLQWQGFVNAGWHMREWGALHKVEKFYCIHCLRALMPMSNLTARQWVLVCLLCAAG